MTPAPETDVPHLSATTAIGRWVLRVGIFLLPLAFLPTIVSEFVLPKLLLARLLVLILLVLLVTGWALQGAITWKRTPLDLPLLAFVGSAALSAAFAVNRTVAIFGTHDRWEGVLTILTYALLFWLAVQFTQVEPDARGLTWSLLISGYVIAVIAVLQGGFGLFGGGYFHVTGGAIRADVTLANPDFLGIFLAMLLPIALSKVLSRRPALTRVLALNLVVVLALGLVFTYTRSAWIGAVIGIVVVISLRRGRFRAWPLIAATVTIVAALAAFALAVPNLGGSQAAQSLYARVLSIADLKGGTENERIQTWRDTLPMIAARPIVGYGPDNFGLVYPDFQSINWQGTLWDRPHEETLGVAAAQGLLGVAAYIWLLVAFARTFWAGRRRRGAVGLFAGWVGYEISTQFNFSYIPTSVPFWLLSAAAIATWLPPTTAHRVATFPRRLAIPTLVASSLAAVAVAVLGVVLPYLAEADYYSAVATADLGQARSLIAIARSLDPFDATYATLAGDFALDLDTAGQPSSNADWRGALEAYTAAADLGSDAPETFQRLAMAREHLGDHAGAVAAARRAVELDRYDPTSRALLASLTS